MRKLLLLLILFMPGIASAQGFDAYGGTLDIQCTYPNADGHWSGTISTLTRSGTTVTVVMSTDMLVAIGQYVFVTGNSNSALNSTLDTNNRPSGPAVFQVASVTDSKHFTYNDINSGAQSGNGGSMIAARPYFQKINNWWWTCTPSGYGLYIHGTFNLSQTASSAAVDGFGILNDAVLSGANSKYFCGIAGCSSSASSLNWAYSQMLRFKAYGLTLIGDESSSTVRATNKNALWGGDQTIPIKLPFTIQRNSGIHAGINHNVESGNNDQIACAQAQTQECSPKKYGAMFKASVAAYAVATAGSSQKQLDMFDPTFGAFMWAEFGPNHMGNVAIGGSVSTAAAPLHNDYFFGMAGNDADNDSCLKQAVPGQPFTNLVYGGGADFPHCGWLALVMSPYGPATPQTILDYNSGADANDIVYLDPKNYTKFEFSQWLQGQGDQFAALSATRSAGTVTLTLPDAFDFMANPVDGFTHITVTGCADGNYNVVNTAITATVMPTQIQYPTGAGGASTSGCVVSIAANASRSANVVTLNFQGFHPFVRAETITVSCPNDATYNSPSGTGVTVTSTTSTTLVYSLNGANGSTTNCTVGSGPGYSTIGALNTAWTLPGGGGQGQCAAGKTCIPQYTTFGSTGTARSQGFVAASNPQTFTPLTFAVDTPLTMQVFDTTTGVLLCGDHGLSTTGLSSGSGFPLSATVGTADNMIGYGCTSASNTTIGGTSVTLTFSNSAGAVVTNGDTITVNYITGGWGVGTGLLDEDGNCPNKAAGGVNNICWVPSGKTGNGGPTGADGQVDDPVWLSCSGNPCLDVNGKAPELDIPTTANNTGTHCCAGAYTLWGASTSMTNDLNGFLFHIGKKWGQVFALSMKEQNPGTLFLTDTNLGAYGAVPYCSVLGGIGGFSDMLTFLYTNDPNNVMGTAEQQSRFDLYGGCFGDRPWRYWNGTTANQDSHMTGINDAVQDTTAGNLSTELARANWLQTKYNNALTFTLSAGCNCSWSGTKPINGEVTWMASDQVQGTNNNAFGVDSWRDDPYDGHSASSFLNVETITAQTNKPLGYPTGCLDPALLTSRVKAATFGSGARASGVVSITLSNGTPALEPSFVAVGNQFTLTGATTPSDFLGGPFTILSTVHGTNAQFTYNQAGPNEAMTALGTVNINPTICELTPSSNLLTGLAAANNLYLNYVNRKVRATGRIGGNTH